MYWVSCLDDALRLHWPVFDVLGAKRYCNSNEWSLNEWWNWKYVWDCMWAKDSIFIDYFNTMFIVLQNETFIELYLYCAKYECVQCTKNQNWEITLYFICNLSSADRIRPLLNPPPPPPPLTAQLRREVWGAEFPRNWGVEKQGNWEF